MLKRTNIAYSYDGSFFGMLCCIFQAFLQKEMPIEIKHNEACFFALKNIQTDCANAERLIRGIKTKICPDAFDYVRLSYLAEFKDKELALISFLNTGFKYGAKTLDMLSDSTVIPIINAVRQLNKEAMRFRQFIRFSDYNGSLISVIEPKNNVLPLIANHFTQRLPKERFMIYDKTRAVALVYCDANAEIVDAEGYQMPCASKQEQEYRDLWKLFYNTIEIKERHNTRCRMNFMPKRFWKNMTEFN